MRKKTITELLLLLGNNLKRRQRQLATIGVCCCYSLALQAGVLESQVNLSLRNATLKEAFQEIQSQSGVSIIYSNNVINENARVTWKKTNASLEETLAVLLKGQNCSFKVENGQVVLYPAAKATPVTAVTQQTVTAKGTIKDKTGEPIIGASVVVKGSMVGTVTDFDGNFEIPDVKKGAILVVSYIGYTSQEVPVAGTALNILLKEDLQNLEEVVVVAFGTQKKVNLTGSVANVDSKLIESRPITSVSAGLQGLLPGVTVTQKSGQPGNDNGTIRVRGTGTFNNADPMVIVDGVEASMNDVDPNDIQSISVLKDAASSAIYGSKAANGVIMVTTKRGKAGKASVSYAANFGWQSPTQLPEYCNSADYAMLTNEARAYSNKLPLYSTEEIQKFRDGSDPDHYANTNWQDLLFVGSGFQQQHNISISGGDEKVRYMTSVGYQGQEGIIKNAGKDQYNIRVNVDANPMERLESSFSVSYSNISLTEPTSSYGLDASGDGGMAQIFRQVNMISPMVPYMTSDGNYGSIGDGNPIAWIDSDQLAKKKRHNMLAVGSLKYHLLDGLSVKAQASYKLYAEDNNTMMKEIQYNANKWHGPSKMWQKNTFEDTAMGDLMLEYKKDFGAHHLDILAGFHSELYNYKYTMAYRQNFPSNNLTDINAGSADGAKGEGYTRQLAMLSWLGRVNYDYAGKYLIEANIRYDGSSRFADGNRWGAFPSFSAGWRLSEEGFFENLKDVFNSVKLRGSWGMLGNQNIVMANVKEYYPTVPTLVLDGNYPFGSTLTSGAYTKYAKNPDLKWEATTTWGVGLDVSLIDKINVTADYYNKKTTGILMEVPTPDTYALEKFVDNVGEVVNSGLELSAQYNDRFGKVDFSFGGNVAFNKNEIKSLGEGVTDIIDGNQIKRVGEALNSFYGYQTNGLYQSPQDIRDWPTYKLTGNAVLPGDIRYVDANNDTELTDKDRVVLDSSDPRITFGFNIGVKYAGFDILAFFQGAAGVKAYMTLESIGSINGDDGKPNSLWMDRWTPENTDAKYPRVCETLNGPSMPSNTVSDFWLQNANYLRLKNLQVGYTFPMKWLEKAHISRLRIYYSAQNILTFTSFLKGLDPEAPSGKGDFYPQTQVHSFGLNLSF